MKPRYHYLPTLDAQWLIAAEEGDLETLQKIKEKHSQVQSITDVGGNNALHKAAWKGHEDVVSWLLNQHFNPDVLNRQNLSPLHLACRFLYSDIVQSLLAFSTSSGTSHQNLRSTWDECFHVYTTHPERSEGLDANILTTWKALMGPNPDWEKFKNDWNLSFIFDWAGASFLKEVIPLIPVCVLKDFLPVDSISWLSHFHGPDWVCDKVETLLNLEGDEESSSYYVRERCREFWLNSQNRQTTPLHEFLEYGQKEHWSHVQRLLDLGLSLQQQDNGSYSCAWRIISGYRTSWIEPLRERGLFDVLPGDEDLVSMATDRGKASLKIILEEWEKAPQKMPFHGHNISRIKDPAIWLMLLEKKVPFKPSDVLHLMTYDPEKQLSEDEEKDEWANLDLTLLSEFKTRFLSQIEQIELHPHQVGSLIDDWMDYPDIISKFYALSDDAWKSKALEMCRAPYFKVESFKDNIFVLYYKTPENPIFETWMKEIVTHQFTKAEFEKGMESVNALLTLRTRHPEMYHALPWKKLMQGYDLWNRFWSYALEFKEEEERPAFLVDLLLEMRAKGIDIHMRTNDGEHLLHNQYFDALHSAYMEIAPETWMETDIYEENILHSLARRNIDLLQKWVENGAEMSCLDAHGETVEDKMSEDAKTTFVAWKEKRFLQNTLNKAAPGRKKQRI